jgi:hypothetical protein
LETIAKAMTTFAFFLMPRSSTLLKKWVLEKRRLEESAWEPSTLEAGVEGSAVDEVECASYLKSLLL